MLFYSNHRRKGFNLTPAQILLHYEHIKSVEIESKGKMQRRRLDKVSSSLGSGSGSGNKRKGKEPGLSREEERLQRFRPGWGWTVSADAFGSYNNQAYGGVSIVQIFCDMGYRNGYFRAVYQKPKLTAASAKALAEIARHWERYGHHSDSWNSPIDELRADSGGFTSEATGELCGEFRIKQRFSVPDTQAQNPVEAHIKQLFRRITMMFAAAPHIPRCMWVYAVEHGIQCLNMAVAKEESGEIPAVESFRSEEVDFWSHPMLPFGQPVEVFIPEENRTWKFGDRSFTGFYVGTPEAYKQGIMVFHPVTGKVRISRDYIILPPESRNEWPLYRAKGAAGNQFIPTQLPKGVDLHDLPETNAMGGDPTALPSEFTDALASAPSFQDDIFEEGSYITDPFKTPCRSDVAEATEFAVSAGLVPVEQSEPQVLTYDTSDVVPVQLQMEYIFISSMDADGQAEEGASINYLLQPEEVDDEDVDAKNEAERIALAHAVTRIRINELKLARGKESTTNKLNKIRDATKAKRTKGAKQRSADNPTLSTALRGDYRQMVVDAIDAEITQYVETYEAIRIFSQEERAGLSMEKLRKAISSHFEITYKRDKVTGELVRVKARLCIHGNETEKYDFDDVRSPTARTASLKIVLALYAKQYRGKRFVGRTWDITGAFLRTKISDRNEVKQAKDPLFKAPEPILLRLPDGRIGEVQSYVYGLKQASLEFRDSVDELLRQHGYRSTSDPCIYVKDEGDDKIVISSHVDDFLAISTSNKMLDDLGKVLAKKYGVGITGNGGDVLEYMGLVIRRELNGVFVSQPAFYKKLWKEYAMDFDLTAEDLEKPLPRYPMHATTVSLDGDEVPINPSWYKGIIGALNYLALMTRPDMSFALSVLASKCQSPTKGDYRKVKHLFKFAMGTAHIGLQFQSDDDFQLHVWADASYASREDARSQNGYCMSLGATNAAFYSKSSKQQLVTLSSTESEYVAMFHASTEVVFLRRLIQQLGFVQEPIKVYQDNESAIRWAHGQENFHRAKHLHVKYHYVRELVKEQVMSVEYLSTKEMVADVLTKPLVSDQFQYLASKLLGVYSFKKRTATSADFVGISVTN